MVAVNGVMRWLLAEHDVAYVLLNAISVYLFSTPISGGNVSMFLLLRLYQL